MFEFFTRSECSKEMYKKERNLKPCWINTKQLAGLQGCWNVTSAINLLDEQHIAIPRSHHQRITGMSANTVLFFL